MLQKIHQPLPGDSEVLLIHVERDEQIVVEGMFASKGDLSTYTERIKAEDLVQYAHVVMIQEDSEQYWAELELVVDNTGADRE